MRYIATILALMTLLSTTFAQFQFFEQMFNGDGGQQQHHHQQRQANVASDSEWYQGVYHQGKLSPIYLPTNIALQTCRTLHHELMLLVARCDKYLCPGTLACVHFPHHCPCAFPDVEDKIELGEGSAICASKGGYKKGETKRKVELARKGLL
jgi:hypothetical protein